MLNLYGDGFFWVRLMKSRDFIYNSEEIVIYINSMGTLPFQDHIYYIVDLHRAAY